MHKLYQNTHFLTGSTRLQMMPPDTGREVAFAGRSNSGKSSALNRICHQKSLARISKTPGRTQQINFFAVAADRYLVDLPGYGYAKIAKSQQQKWGDLLQNYLLKREALAGLVVLMDIRHPLTSLDNQLLVLCQTANVPVHILLTKADKLKRGAAKESLKKISQQLFERGGNTSVQLFSSLTGEGINTVQTQLDEWLGFDSTQSPPTDSRPKLL